MGVSSDPGTRPDASDLLAHWISQARLAVRSRRRPPDVVGGSRFAFYGRVSTADFQEPDSSRRWQQDVAEDLVAGHGRIVVEFFDTDRSRRLSWSDRPEAAALLAMFADPDRGLDAVVVDEYERAFYGDQVLTLLPIFEEHSVQARRRSPPRAIMSVVSRSDGPGGNCGCRKPTVQSIPPSRRIRRF
jgi:site-specific DNA recombinase